MTAEQQPQKLTEVQRKRRQEMNQQQKLADAARDSVKVIEVAPVATRARMRLRHWMVMLSFLLAVVFPGFGVGYYLYTIAANQYASTVEFTVRTEKSSSAMDLLGGFANFSGNSSSDTDILYKFIQSVPLVAAIDESLDLRKIYRRPEYDPVYVLKDNASIEDLVDYWGKMVRISYEPSSKLIQIETRAFSPEDAQTIAKEILARSSVMINKLSAVAREDTTRFAREELDHAVSRLKDARKAIQFFRNENQIVDPSADISSQMGLLNSLQAELAQALINLDLLTSTATETDPRIAQTKRTINAIEKRIKEERNKLGVGGGTADGSNAFANLVGQYEGLRVDLEFAQKAYLSSLAAFESATAEARRQSRYLAAYVLPTLAQTPEYPQRLTNLIVAVLILTGFWLILVLIFYSLRDRR